MVDIRNRNLPAVADVAEAEPAIDDLEWYGFDPAAWHPIHFIQLLLHDSFDHLNNQMFGWEFNIFWLEL